jgi:diguanylate cyclase (GGDEF)-like protein
MSNSAAELAIANKELAFQNEEKDKRAAELTIANKELAFQNEEKDKRAAELTIANKELAFQNEEKDKRAAELAIANKELAFQHEEKDKRAAELAKVEAQLQVLANTDPLTGLFNRRVFFEQLEQERAKVARLSNYSVVLLMLDLDFFKRVNDIYGHASGDAVLKAFADIARNNSRTIDIPARLGGEEFAILLIGADKNDSQIMAERFRKQVEEIVIAHELGLVRITVSIGAACVLADDINGEAVMNRADAALYKAKENGRNQICWFTR